MHGYRRSLRGRFERRPVRERSGLGHGILTGALGLVLAGCPGTRLARDECDEDHCGEQYCDENRVVTCTCFLGEGSYHEGSRPYFRSLEVAGTCTGDEVCTLLSPDPGADPLVHGIARCLHEACATDRGSPNCADDLCTGLSGQSACLFVDGSTSAQAYVHTCETYAGGAVSLWMPTEDTCTPCRTDCDCGATQTCNDFAVCVPGSSDVTCCGRERKTPCPSGVACIDADGTPGVCSGGPRCAACSALADCADLDCIDTRCGPTSVCLSAEDGALTALECRSGVEIWRTDACGREVLVDTCPAGYACHDGDCVKALPDVVVSPMLLPFPDTALGTSSSLTLSVGNVGFGTLTVTDIAVDPGFEASFAIVPSSTTVLVNQIVDLTVTFTPQSLGLTAAQLYVRSDDPDEPEVAVLMNGKGL